MALLPPAVRSFVMTGLGSQLSVAKAAGEAKAPPLEPLPPFQEIPQVHYSGK